MDGLLELAPTAIRVDGHEGVGINVWDFGGEGPNLVLSHCTGTHGRVWDPLVPALRDRFRVVAWDSRGHGDSDKPSDLNLYTWKLSGLDVVKVFEALELDSDVRAIGHSAGAAHLCYADLLHPGVISRAIVMDPIIHPPEFHNENNPLAIAARKRRRYFDSKQAAWDNFASKPPLNAWTPETISAYVEYGFAELPDGRIELKCLPEIESELYARGGSTDIFERLGDISFDVTLVTSDQSNVRIMAEHQKDKFRDPHYVMLEGASHFIPQEQPQAIVDMAFERLL